MDTPDASQTYLGAITSEAIDEYRGIIEFCRELRNAAIREVEMTLNDVAAARKRLSDYFGTPEEATAPPRPTTLNAVKPTARTGAATVKKTTSGRR